MKLAAINHGSLNENFLKRTYDKFKDWRQNQNQEEDDYNYEDETDYQQERGYQNQELNNIIQDIQKILSVQFNINNDYASIRNSNVSKENRAIDVNGWLSQLLRDKFNVNLNNPSKDALQPFIKFRPDGNLIAKLAPGCSANWLWQSIKPGLMNYFNNDLKNNGISTVTSESVINDAFMLLKIGGAFMLLESEQANPTIVDYLKAYRLNILLTKRFMEDIINAYVNVCTNKDKNGGNIDSLNVNGKNLEQGWPTNDIKEIVKKFYGLTSEHKNNYDWKEIINSTPIEVKRRMFHVFKNGYNLVKSPKPGQGQKKGYDEYCVYVYEKFGEILANDFKPFLAYLIHNIQANR